MLKISFTDFWNGFDVRNNIITNMLKDIYNNNVEITVPRKADICFVTIYGRNHAKILKKFSEKCFLFLGENVRPNTYNASYSFSGDFYSYGGKNKRLPLWYLEIDWYDTNLGTISVNDLEKKLLSYGDVTTDNLLGRRDCITIFNNKEGTRMEVYRKLNKIMSIDGYGKPFNNWFPTYNDYKSKLEKMGNYKFNFCPENSIYPGYYTEKCFHAKLAGCIPIYFAEKYVTRDFRKEAFINIYNYLSFDDLKSHLVEILNDYDYLTKLINQQLLHKLPNLEEIKEFLHMAVSNIR